MNSRLVLALLLGFLAALIYAGPVHAGNRSEIKRLKAEIAEMERQLDELTGKIIAADQEASRLHDKAAFTKSPENVPITNEAKGWDKRADTLREQRFKLQRRESDLEATLNSLKAPK